MRAITFPKTSDGVWTNSETGVKIERYGQGYRAFRPADTSDGYIGICCEVRTLADARDEASRYVANAARFAIAKAHDEALKIDRGYPSGQSRNWREQVYRRAVEVNTASPHLGNATDMLIDEAYAEALEDDAAYRQNAEYRHRMQWQRTVDEDHVEALAYDAYRTELKTELGKFARGEEPYPYFPAGFQVGDRVAFGPDTWEVEEVRGPNSAHGHSEGTLSLRNAEDPSRRTSVFVSTPIKWAHDEAHRENAARIIASARAPQDATGPSLPEVPADLDDDQAWAAYCAALPEPTDKQIADVLAEYGDPYAASRAEVADRFRDAARMIRKMRSAQRIAGATLDEAMISHLRKSMRTLRGVIEIYDQLTESWRLSIRAGCDRDSFTRTF